MASIAVVAIYLAALRTVSREPSDNPLGLLSALLSVGLLMFVLPFHVIAVWRRLTSGETSAGRDA
jgi:hypothetical protein